MNNPSATLFLQGFFVGFLFTAIGVYIVLL